METPDLPNTGRTLARIGAWLQIGIPLGVGGTVMGMVQAFEELGAAGAGDPSRLSAAIGHVLYFTALGIFIALIGAVLMILALVRWRYRAEWFFWTLMIFGGLWIVIFFPIGLFLVIHAMKRRREFVDPCMLMGR